MRYESTIKEATLQISVGWFIPIIGGLIVFFVSISWGLLQRLRRVEIDRLWKEQANMKKEVENCEVTDRQFSERVAKINGDMRVIQEQIETLQKDVGKIDRKLTSLDNFLRGRKT